MYARNQFAMVLTAAAVLCSVGCAEPFDDSLPAPTDPSRLLVEAQLDRLDELLTEAARADAIDDAIHEITAQQARRPFADRVEDGLRYSTVFTREYVDADRSRAFVDQWGLTARGERLLALLDDADRHALNFETLHREEIHRQLREIVIEPGGDSAYEDFSPTVAEIEVLVDLVADVSEETTEPVRLTEAVHTIDDHLDGLQQPGELADYYRRQKHQFADRARQFARLELMLADAALRYARQMRHANIERVPPARLARLGSTEIILARMQRTLDALHTARIAEFDDVLHNLEPRHPQYRALLEATDRYRQIVADGGWNRVAPFDVEPGAASARVAQLRARLEAEGYRARPDAPDSNFSERVVDDTLVEAIKEYQKTHQFNPDGVPTAGFWRSLNIPAHQRLQQMELTLQRWRESHLEDDDDFILVNIPGFTAQVWTGGELRLEFPVVVGNNRRHCDEETEQWVYPDATPVVMSELDHVMFNPYWYVPQRIAEQTLRPRLEENEDYFEQEGYEEVELAGGREVIRQKPGENNALGVAKFIFPNQHNVYLHDTPDTEFFHYEVRPFSHGCVRVSKPVELAEVLLEWEGRDDLDIHEILEAHTESDDGEESRPSSYRVSFEREMPVMLEYYTVWIDDEGRPNFLADIYDSDAHRLADDPDEFFECDPDEFADSEKTEEQPDGEDEEDPEELDEDVGP